MPLSKRDYESLASFRYTLRTFLRFSEQAAATLSLSPSQHQALLAIQGFPGKSQITIGELAERLQIEHHSAVGLIDRLEKRMLVQRVSDGDDKRRVNVSVTKVGLRYLDKLSQVHRRELQRIGPEIRSILQRLEEETPAESDSNK